MFLLPPDMAEWLPEDHLVWFVLDVVAGLDRPGSMPGGGWGVWAGGAMTRTCLRYDSRTRAYDARRTTEGLSKPEIIRCLSATSRASSTTSYSPPTHRQVEPAPLDNP